MLNYCKNVYSKRKCNYEIYYVVHDNHKNVLYITV